MKTLFPATLLALLTVASCAGPRAIGDRMFDHFGRAAEVQSALIVGDLEGARRPARWLAESESLEGSGRLADPWVEQLRAAARSVAEAGSIAEAADGTARLAASCAGCHTTGDDGPRFRSTSSPREGPGIGDHMIRHLWAMDRMWEGLVGASGETWRAGARLLAEEGPQETLARGNATAAMARELHGHAERAERTPAADRPGVYADLLRSCAACHTRMGIGDTP